MKSVIDHDEAVTASDLYAAAAEIRAVLGNCKQRGMSDDAIASALLAELMPRLTHRFGPQAVASVSGNLASAPRTPVTCKSAARAKQ